MIYNYLSKGDEVCKRKEYAAPSYASSQGFSKGKHRILSMHVLFYYLIYRQGILMDVMQRARIINSQASIVLCWHMPQKYVKYAWFLDQYHA